MRVVLSLYLLCWLLYFIRCQSSESTTLDTSNPSSTDSTATAPTTTTTPPTTTTTTPTTTTTTPTTTTTTPTSTTPTTTTTTPTTTTPPTTTARVVLDRKSFTWTASDIEEYNYVIFEVDDGYFISVTVSNVNMSDGNYVLIEGGDSHKDGATDGRVFANTVAGPLSYLFKTSSVYALCENTHTAGVNKNYYDFTMDFERVGELTTTVVTTTTTTVSTPPTKKGDEVYITVNITGRALPEYSKTEVVQDFKKCVSIMANNYCKQQGITLEKNITTEYVMIAEISHCPYIWPNSAKCVKIKFKLPIFTADSDEYHLKSQELKAMWLRWDTLDEQCLKNNSFMIYTEPNVGKSMMWWAIGISLVTLVLIILLLLLRIFSSRIKTATKKKRNSRDSYSDTRSIMSRETDSICSLPPHYLQDRNLGTPKLFEN